VEYSAIALRKRGILPETIRRLIIEVGPKTVDVTLSWDNLYAINRKLIDIVANRYFFVRDPRKIVVKRIQRAVNVKTRLHPEHPERGFRIFKIKPKNGEAAFWISGQDANLLKKDNVVRLMGFINIKIENVSTGVIEAVFHSKSHEEAKKLNTPLIQWVPAETGVPCEVIMPDATTARGIAEDSSKQLKPKDIIQFERFGFVRVDSIDWKLSAYFAHR
jgi:glutamyl-tRNA synthetase